MQKYTICMVIDNSLCSSSKINKINFGIRGIGNLLSNFDIKVNQTLISDPKTTNILGVKDLTNIKLTPNHMSKINLGLVTGIKFAIEHKEYLNSKFVFIAIITNEDLIHSESLFVTRLAIKRLLFFTRNVIFINAASSYDICNILNIPSENVLTVAENTLEEDLIAIGKTIHNYFSGRTTNLNLNCLITK